MPDFILHHYEISPFAAKIRAMLGYCELPWLSARTTPMPPRPLVDTLAGGYRRIPVAQIGADIFCDSRVICEEIAALAGRPELSPQSLDGTQRAFVDRAEMGVFFSLVGAATGWPLVRKVVADVGPLGLLRLLRDRKGMREGMSPDARPPQDGTTVVQAYLDDLEVRLTSPFLNGEQPGLIDFSAWHGLWFAIEVGGKSLLPAHPQTRDWFQRLAHLHSTKWRDISADSCIAAARDSEPRALPDSSDSDALLGQPVSIAPSDYGLAAVRGTLVASLPQRFILRRETAEAGVVHVHFPRARFSLEVAG
ncbi:glutathione S-transferase family protein [Parahaliea aestuarii]|uniref:glutathione S-transferase family protein n=1 Tax=Parahaliea aestuarii TaxID=1852021 RepID=UPI0016504B9E|nr:glutathione S-transferase family protein [Parahaliea aestuarii]